MISDNYRKLLKEMHTGSFGSGGHKHSDTVLMMCKRLGTEDVLDYGCGKCTLSKSLPFPIKNYDPAIDNLDMSPEPADIVVCTDVLEHIEPEHLDDVLAHIGFLMKKKGYLVISTRKANKSLPDGRNAHLIVKDCDWWRDKINEFFEIEGMEILKDEVRFQALQRLHRI